MTEAQFSRLEQLAKEQPRATVVALNGNWPVVRYANGQFRTVTSQGRLKSISRELVEHLRGYREWREAA